MDKARGIREGEWQAHLLGWDKDVLPNPAGGWAVGRGIPITVLLGQLRRGYYGPLRPAAALWGPERCWTRS